MRNTNSPRARPPVFWAILALTLAAVACNLGGSGTPTLPPTILPTVIVVPPAETATLAATTTPECELDSEFVADVTIPDGTPIARGETFVKTWRLRNNGTCAWEDGSELIQTGGDQLVASGPVALPSLPPGGEAEISVSLLLLPDAPLDSEQVAAFKMRGPDGEFFGGTPYVIVVVAGEEPPTPTPIVGLTTGASVGGVVWSDDCRMLDESTPSEGCVADGAGGYRANGVFDEGEGRIMGVTVKLSPGACSASGVVYSTDVTGEDGAYLFDGLQAGQVCVRIDALAAGNASVLIPGSWTFPAGATDAVAQVTITLAEDEERNDVDFGWDYQLD